MSCFENIIAAYNAALGGRDPNRVDILDLLPAIYDAVPDVTPREIVAALRWSADQDLGKADALEEKRTPWPPANDA